MFYSRGPTCSRSTVFLAIGKRYVSVCAFPFSTRTKRSQYHHKDLMLLPSAKSFATTLLHELNRKLGKKPRKDYAEAQKGAKLDKRMSTCRERSAPTRRNSRSGHPIVDQVLVSPDASRELSPLPVLSAVHVCRRKRADHPSSDTNTASPFVASLISAFN